MNALLRLSAGVDWVSTQLGRIAACTVLAAALISAGNALVRYLFHYSSNGWLEIQWYLFGATVMLGAPVVLKRNEHVRVDILYGRLTGNGPVYLDLFGLLFFLLPTMGFIAWSSWPLFLSMFLSGEGSLNTGGLVRWPAMALLPFGFAMVFLQGVSEVIKRMAYLQGRLQLDLHYEKPVQ